MELKKNLIEFEMTKIEREIAERKLTKNQRVKADLKAQLGKNASVSNKDVQDKLMEINKKNFSSNFTSTSRDRRQFIFRNKTDPPELGKYNPRMNSIDKREKKATIFKEWEFSESAKKKKIEFDF